MPRWISEKSIELFTKHKIFTKEEIFSRYEILLENYSKSIHIEALTMQEMIRKDLTEGILSYEKDITKEMVQKQQLLGEGSGALEKEVLKVLDGSSSEMYKALTKLAQDTATAETKTDILEQASFYQETVLSDMDELRKYADQAEAMIPDKYLGYPTYGQMLFSVR